MNVPTRKFDDVPAVREQVPLLIGLMGPSGSGKTYSALRLATGIQEVTGGEIYVIDTEARRALHYAEQFKFRHVQFDAPFGSLDYLAAIRHCVAKGAKVIVIDSMSHEHIGPGGYLLTQDAEVQRMAGDDYAKRERVKMAGWIKPSNLRQQMITGILQLNVNFIFCFRAKEKTKPKQGGGIQEMGFMPVAGEELLFEMTVNALLPPKSNGIPQWRSDQVGEKLMMKLPKQFERVFANTGSLDEQTGRQLAEWAKGGTPTPTRAEFKPTDAMVPTAGEYVEQWRGIMMAATRADQLGQTWNEQKKLRDKILWPDDGTFDGLRAKVMSVIEHLKATA
jgi:ABC-type dipeptide/oligopeptide/nickel transport system ATPase subunit